MTRMMPKIGQIFDGRYELLEELGAGGVGRTFKAKQLDLGRTVALKICHPHLAEDEDFRSRFLREAQSLNEFQHLNIVTLYHIGLSESGIPYLVMEMLRGSSLRSVLSLGKLSLHRAVRISRDAALALAHVHKCGIVHRDLKPDNILLVDKPEPDTVKVIDFGFARVVDGQGQKLTRTGTLIGSVHYMSPEQCAGLKVEPASDVYSLCLCLYEMLTAEKAFDADTAMGLMYKHLHDPVPLVGGSKYAAQLNSIIGDGCRKEIGKRIQSMEELAARLEELLLLVEQGEFLVGKSAVTLEAKSEVPGWITILVLSILFPLLASFYYDKTAEKLQCLAAIFWLVFYFLPFLLSSFSRLKHGAIVFLLNSMLFLFLVTFPAYVGGAAGFAIRIFGCLLWLGMLTRALLHLRQMRRANSLKAENKRKEKIDRILQALSDCRTDEEADAILRVARKDSEIDMNLLYMQDTVRRMEQRHKTKLD